jgi:hypothetical protein
MSEFPDPVRAVPQPRFTITIFCWILKVSKSEFLVDIEYTPSVGHLKGAIVKASPNTFPGVDAHQLTVWKVGSFSVVSPIFVYQVSIPITRQGQG